MAIISAYPVGTPAAGDYLVGSDITTAGTQINPTKNFVLSDVVATGLGYTVYTALVTQTGLTAPTDIVLKNDTGATMTWARTGTGIYKVFSSPAIFALNKTIVFINNGSKSVGTNSPEWTRSADDNITIDTDGADSKLASASFEIRIYT